MYKKIKTEQELLNLKVGDIIVKYPVDEEAEDKGILDIVNAFRYEIYSINKEEKTLDLRVPEDEIPTTINIKGLYKITGISNNPQLLLKKFQKIVEEQKWWRTDLS